MRRGSLVPLSDRTSRSPAITGTSHEASVSETNDWQLAVFPGDEAHCGAMPTTYELRKMIQGNPKNRCCYKNLPKSCEPTNIQTLIIISFQPKWRSAESSHANFYWRANKIKKQRKNRGGLKDRNKPDAAARAIGGFIVMANA